MSRHKRYEVIDLIGQGDYATVYRGRDRELNREVAIKQIHPQFLNDPQKLERYWQEAKLLASLEHPYIMTIYDVVKERGWLILELMQGSLEQKLCGQPIDLEDLRLTIIYMCHALRFLRKNGIVHGDVKPSNLMLDRNHRVKLGDFGIARRLASDEGSVIKGTTKYMAPEVVSDQFGPVGHHSDLYSLGFSAYALMCGEHFDALFPGLHVAGRDPQIAWMMWHSAADRQVPEIDKVLEGVPPALSRAVQKLTYKDPAQRYQNSEQVIADLKAHAEGKDPDELAAAEVAERQQSQRRQRTRRRWAYAAVGLSLGLSVAMLLLGPDGSAPRVRNQDAIQAGTIVSIDPARSLIGISSDASDRSIHGVELQGKQVRIFLNDQRVTLDQLEVGDTLRVEITKSVDQHEYYLVEASRPPEEELIAEIRTVRAAEGMLVVSSNSQASTSKGDPPIAELEVYVPTNLRILFNGRMEWHGKAMQVSDLRSGDRVVGRYVSEDGQNALRQLEVTRDVDVDGQLHTVNRDLQELSLKIGDGTETAMRTYPIADDCRVSINGRKTFANGQQVSLADLRMGDRITIRHDDQVRSIEARRELVSSGVVDAVSVDGNKLNVSIEELSRTVPFQVTSDTLIGLAENGEPCDLGFVQAGDRVVIEHESVDLVEPFAHVVRVEPKPRTDTWAVLVNQTRFDDRQVSVIPTSEGDADLVKDALESRYRVPDYQLLEIENPTRLTLQNELEEFLIDIPSNGHLIIYLSTRAFMSPDNVPVLATREFEPKRMEETGIELQELIDLLERFPTSETTLLLDLGHRGMEQTPWQQPSSAEAVAALKMHPSHPVSQKIEVIASCSSGETNQLTNDGNSGIFAASIASGYRGGADQNGDRVINASEIAGYLVQSVAQDARDLSGTQTVVHFVPGEKPSRLHPETIAAVENLLTFLQQSRFSTEWTSQFEAALENQPDEPDVGIAYALVHLRHDRTGESRAKFEELRARFPNRFVPHFALAWQYLLAKDADAAAAELRDAVGTLPFVAQVGIPRKSADVEQATPAEALAERIGTMAGFAIHCADERMESEDAMKLEAAVAQLPEPLVKAYRNGLTSVEDKATAIDMRIKSASSQDRDRLERERSRLSTYAQLDFKMLSRYLHAQLNTRRNP